MKTRIRAVMLLLFVVFLISCTPKTPPEKEVPAGGEAEIAQGSQQDFPAKLETESEPVSEKPQNSIPEISNMPTESVAETLSFSWEKDGGSRVVDGSVPFAHALEDGNVRLYYCNSKGILSAISKDGMAFAKEEGIRISPGTGF